MASDIKQTTLYGTAADACSTCGAIGRVLNKPLVGNVDTIHLFMVIGVALISVLIWSRVLAHIKG